LTKCIEKWVGETGAIAKGDRKNRLKRIARTVALAQCFRLYLRGAYTCAAIKWRKCMGIEPTGRAVNVRPNGFEDRGHHQVCKHFRFTFQATSSAYCEIACRQAHDPQQLVRNFGRTAVSKLKCNRGSKK